MKACVPIICAVVFAVVSARGDSWKMFDRRLGMFVHWGIYSVGEWHEQEQYRAGLSRAEYGKFLNRFAAEKFDADALVDVAKVELMPWNAGATRKRTLHVWGIPADELANECMVLRLDFKPGALALGVEAN